MLGVMVSPVTGSSGNVEFVGQFVTSADSSRSVTDDAISAVVDHAQQTHGGLVT